ncbi:glycoside hydrolase family 99-like domain-containing protein [Plantibacter sp. YIM 135347]|uniref:glycoside hydrolase family 99-like domain-containing protein n=1 Tax=Plantibacter sp. YIM 135347 TaxID=3423919 RepID=UPI003D35481D
MTLFRRFPALAPPLAIGVIAVLAATTVTASAAVASPAAAAGAQVASVATGLAAETTTPAAHPGPTGDDYFIGANYFSGWRSGDNFHFDYLDGTDWRPDHPELEPTYGWYDDTQPVIDQQIVDASANGLDYFVFDWYPERPTIGDGGELGGLHTGMNLFRTSVEKQRMQFMVNYIDGGPFNIGALRTKDMTQAQYETVRAAEWDTITTKWVELFQDPSYVKIDGKPVIEIYDVQRFTTDFSTGTRPNLNPHELAQVPQERAVMTAAVNVLKAKAATAGFPDVLIGGGLQQPGFAGEYVSAHDYDGLYDFFTAYAWHDMKRVPDADNSYDNLIRDNHDYVWDYYAKYKDPAVDYVPMITQGWDNIVHPDYPKWSIDKTPEAFGNSLREAKAYLDEHPQTNLSSGNPLKMSIIGSWNELFEGHYFLPTKADGDAYTSQVGRVFGTNDAGSTTAARAVNLVAEAQTVLDAILAALAGLDAAEGSPEQTALAAARDGLQSLVAVATPVGAAAEAADAADASEATRAADTVTDAAPIVAGIPALLAATSLTGVDALGLQRAWAGFVEASFGLAVTAGASDYSLTAGETTALHFDVEGSAAVTDVDWTVQYPDTWDAADVPLTGSHPDTSIVVPASVGDGRLYNVSDMFPGPSDMIGNRQELTVAYSFEVGGVTVSSTIPLPLTIIRDLSSRVIRNGFDGTANHHSVWIHNQTDHAVTGTLAIPTAPGVTVSAYPTMVSLAADERREVPVTITNDSGYDVELPITFTVGGAVVPLGTAFVSPDQVAIPSVPTQDATTRSDGPAEVNNANGRLQVGNAARVGGTNTEYRPVVSFDLTAARAGDVTRVVLDLTEFESGNAAPIVLEHLGPVAAPSAADFASPALATAPFPISGTPSSTGTHRQVDVTAWVKADLAAGKSLSSFRIRLDTLVPTSTSYRAFRPAEFTPADPKDAPQLLVVFAP